MMSQNADSLIGKKLGSCTLQQLIGRGGMGDVYLAQQARPERQVAIKILQPMARDAETYRQFLVRFQREANLIARLDHVNIMPIYEYGEQDGLTYLVMPYLTGGSLRDLLKQRGSLSLPETLQYIQQAADALDYAHARGVIHRDLKPANFLFHADGRLILADFGIARILENTPQPGAESTLTGTGMLVGTPEYMAPEMARGDPIDQRADVYELGIVLYQMLSGSVPFKGGTPLVIAAMHLQQTLPLLHTSMPSIRPDVDRVIQTATAKLPAERYPSAGAVAQQLRQVVTGVNPTSSPLSPMPAGPDVSTVSLTSATTAFSPTLATTPAPETFISPRPASYPAYLQTPMQTPPPFQQPEKPSRLPWLIPLTILLTALVVIGSIFVGLQLMRNNASSNVATPQTVLLTPTSPAVSSATPTPTQAQPTPTPSPASIAYPSQPDAEQEISTYYTTKSDFRGKNVIQHFDSLSYGPFIGPADQPQFIACAQYEFALVTSPNVTQDTARHTFTFQYSSNAWSVIDMGNWASC